MLAQLSWLRDEALRYHAAWLKATHVSTSCEELLKQIDDELSAIRNRVKLDSEEIIPSD